MKKTLLYIANPYTDDEHDVMISRVAAVTDVVEEIIENFEHIIPFSPVVYAHLFSERVDRYVNWYEFDLVFLDKCDMVLVLQLDGWDSSYGVGLEKRNAMRQGIPVVYATPDNVLEVLNGTSD